MISTNRKDSITSLELCQFRKNPIDVFGFTYIGSIKHIACDHDQIGMEGIGLTDDMMDIGVINDFTNM